MPPRKKIVESEWMKIGPREAEKLLATSAINRRLRPRLVECYAEDMREGLWDETGEAIKLSRTGQLLDGQHRLNAIIEAGVTLELLVVRGLGDQSQALMDQGASRTAKDALDLAGTSYASWSSAIARWVLLAGEPGPGMEQALKKKASTARIMKTVAENPDIGHAAARYPSLQNHIPGSPTAIGYSWFWMNRIDPAACHEFFDAMVNMSFSFQRDPRKAALRTLQRLGDHGINPSSKDKAFATVSVLTRAWNGWRAGEEMETIRVKQRGRIIPPETPV